ncbi:MAG: FAD-dependent oxidoreductase [Nanoarchaeota archaeon]|nr:FAD-dependent oxidoreductase [Nanoarchaeota archaeon]
MKKYDVAIIGAGVTGTSLLYVLSKYTNIKNLVLLEKYKEIAAVNSQRNNNSQTLHFGDIETNYNREKAAKVKEAAEMVAKYVETVGKEEGLHYQRHKMVLAVGEEEVTALEKRFEEIKDIFPKLKKISKEEIAKLEPNTVKGRNPEEKLLALCTEDGYAIDFGKLSESFVKHAQKSGKTVDVFMHKKIKEIQKNKKGYKIISEGKTVEASAVVVCAGSHSLILAQQLGYGTELGLLPVAGSFYIGKNMLNGKVYTMQLKKLPFAAIHGDPDVKNPAETRFGPTAKVLPLLERHRYTTIPDFIRTSVFTIDGILSLLKILADPTYFRFVLKNFSYDLPFIGKRIFLKDVQKIVPSATAKDIHLGKGIGGIRPQIVDTKTKTMNMGEAKIVGEKIIFNITPSPGASVCLKNAENDARKVVEFLGKRSKFDEQKLKEALGSKASGAQK